MLIYLYTLDYPDRYIDRTQKPTKADQTSKLPHLRFQRQNKMNLKFETAQSSDLENILMNNILVYALADKYYLLSMKIVAKNRFLAFTKDVSWPYIIFKEVMQTVYSTIPDTDNGLRFVITDICVDNFSEIVGDLKLIVALMDEGKLSFSIACRQFANHQAATKLLENDVPREKQTLAVSRAELVRSRLSYRKPRKKRRMLST